MDSDGSGTIEYKGKQTLQQFIFITVEFISTFVNNIVYKNENLLKKTFQKFDKVKNNFFGF